MSVLKSKRGESAMQFLETARELEVYTIRQCARFPKRFMFLITKDIVALSKAVYNNVKAANSVYPTGYAPQRSSERFCGHLVASLSSPWQFD